VQRRPTTTLLLALLFLAPPAWADEVRVQSVQPEKRPYRGTSLTYRHTVTTRTFDKSLEHTWNPYYAQTVVVAPMWWLGDRFHVSANALFTREFTESDTTTEADETLMGDVSLRASAPSLVRLEAAGLSLGIDLAASAPTSKASKARTMIAALGPGVALSWKGGVLSGLSVSLSTRMTRYFHEFTTSGRETPLIGSCAATTEGCGAFLNTGVRNTEWRLTHGLTISLALTEWLSLSVSQVLSTDWLYALDGDLLPTLTPQEGQNKRFGSAFDVSVGVEAISGLDLRLGMATAGPQLAPDSSYYNPFYNRYTALYLDLVCDLDGVVSLLTDAAAQEP
jgi:hypothetical protein